MDCAQSFASLNSPVIYENYIRVRASARVREARAMFYNMRPQRLTPEGGNGDLIAFRVARGSAKRLDEVAQNNGFESRSELLRALVDYVTTEDALPSALHSPMIPGGLQQAS
jgi:hypothetical protein